MPAVRPIRACKVRTDPRVRLADCLRDGESDPDNGPTMIATIGNGGIAPPFPDLRRGSNEELKFALSRS